MIFKNATIYRTNGYIGPVTMAGVLVEGLAAHRFAPCGLTQEASSGFVPPRRGDTSLLEVVGGQMLMCLQTEVRMLPGSVVKERAQEMAKAVEASTGRKPGRKQMKELTENARLELLPMAFTKQHRTNVWLSPNGELLVVDTASRSKADAVVTAIMKAAGEVLQVQNLHTNDSPTQMMAGWLLAGEPADGFTLDRECELKSCDEMKSVVRYGRHALDIDEVRTHIRQGKQPTRLAVTWNSRVSFVLMADMTLRKVEFLDSVLDAEGTEEDRFDTDAAIMTADMLKLVNDLVWALGGEHKVDL